MGGHLLSVAGAATVRGEGGLRSRQQSEEADAAAAADGGAVAEARDSMPPQQLHSAAAASSSLSKQTLPESGNNAPSIAFPPPANLSPAGSAAQPQSSPNVSSHRDITFVRVQRLCVDFIDLRGVTCESVSYSPECMMQLGEAFRTESGPDRRYYLAVHCLKQTRDDSLGFTLSEVWVCCLLEPIDISGSLFRQLPERYCLKITTQDALRSVRRMEVLRSRPIQERFMEECSIHQELHQRYGLSSAAAGSPTSARSGTAAPGLCPLVSIAADDDAYYLLTPYLGVDLFAFMRDRARRGLRVSEAEARSLFSDMVNSLIAMHRCGICHRDVSPQNFVVKEQPGTVRCSLIDFGMATRLDVGPNGHPAPLFLTEGFGKPEFIPPEQCLDLHMPYDGFKADVYSLGVTLFFMLTGGTSPPFTLPTEASAPYRVIVIENNLRKYFSTRGLCGERVAPSEDAIDLLSRMLRHRPEDRCSLEDVANHVWCRRTAPVSVLLTPTQQPPPAAPQRSIDQPQPPELKHLARTNLVSLSVNAFGESREGASALPELSIGDLDLSRSGNLERQSSSDSSQYDAVVGAKSASPIGFQIVNLARSSSGDPLDPGPPAVPLSLDSPPQATYAALYSSNPLSSSGDSLGTLPSKKLRR